MRIIIDFAFVIFYIYLIASAIFLIYDNRKPSSTIAWLFVFTAIPVFGIIFYIIFGKNHKVIGKRRKGIEENCIDKFCEILKGHQSIHENVKAKLNKNPISIIGNKIVNLLENNSFSLLSENSKVEIIQSGEEKFSKLKDDLKNAKKFIHMAYYIWRYDNLTREIQDILIERAKNGVEVRVLVDALGSFSLPKKYCTSLRNAGVKIYRYFDFDSPFTLHTINHRNHRKIVVIDGTIGYAGGMNMGQEYITGAFGFKRWRDTHVRIFGDSVKNLQAIFSLEWENTTKQKLYDKKYFPDINEKIGNTIMQTTLSGPDSQWDAIKQMYFTMISSAKKSIYIQTPYFIPDEGLIDSLKTASLSGITVKIIVTGIPDNKAPYWAAFTYFEELIESGIEIYHYNKCFLHSKVIVIDSEICSIGTANFDIRSFTINYELMMVFYDSKISKNLVKDLEKDIESSSIMTTEKYNAISSVAKFRNSIARLASPLL